MRSALLCVIYFVLSTTTVSALDNETNTLYATLYWSNTQYYKSYGEYTEEKLTLTTLKNNAFEQNFDIAGIKLDDDFILAHDKLKSVNPQYKIIKGGNITMATAGGTFFKEGNDIVAIAQDSSKKIWFIKREQKMEKNDRLNGFVFLDSLFEKYGKPSDYWKDACHFQWAYNRDGKLLSRMVDSSRTANCDNVDLGKVGASCSSPNDISGTCGKIIDVVCDLDSDSLVGSFQITIVNYKNVYDEIIAPYIKEQEIEKQRKQKMFDDAKKNKPQL